MRTASPCPLACRAIFTSAARGWREAIAIWPRARPNSSCRIRSAARPARGCIGRATSLGYDRDGRLHYLGRRDQQIKLKGFRIEPGEIEAVLRQDAEVAQAVVAVRQTRHGDARLIAYAVPVPGTQLDAADLRQRLARALPPYMVPAWCVILEALPLTPNGKVDRSRLQDPDPPIASGTDGAPRTDVEAQWCEIWRMVLGVDRVGIHDNFFDLGGDSIRSVRLVGRARQAGFRITPRQIFEHQTIAQLAAATDVSHVAQAAVVPPLSLPAMSPETLRRISTLLER